MRLAKMCKAIDQHTYYLGWERVCLCVCVCTEGEEEKRKKLKKKKEKPRTL